jgi:phosphoserine phosphatase
MNKLICFDFDGTLTEQSSWYLFNTNFGMTPEEDHSLFQQYLENGFDYKTWTRQIVAILKERNLLNKESLEEFVKTIKLREDANKLISACKEADYKTVIISGGLKQVVEHVADTLGVDRILTTAELIFNANGSFEDIVDTGDEMYAKVKAFETICAEYSVNSEDAIAVGDGGNDLEIFKKTKKGILLGSYEKLKPFSWKQVQSLSEIKELI